ncbi:MAG: thiamine pyrophosphate-dependent dehydrogenase E1 component subunit alpha [Burkholderiaceae bacterium]|nr:thiamine pyrophosphate-dependent dehydrogenase E1 component subunit alpha [Burkholderiaceae bacterium]
MKPATEPDPRLSMLEAMMTIRAYENRLVAINAQTGAAGTCTSVGQEAGAVGVVRALERRDRMVTNHRSAGHLLARGADPGRMMAEVLGRVDGYCKGKSGSLHISAKELGVVLTSTIVGGELSMVTGVALAQKMGVGEPGGIVATFFGDGAACEGIFHESLNLAAQWRLPILYVCENNQWQAFVRRDETMPIEHIRTWAAAHAVESETVDGNDVEAVHVAARKAVAAIRATGRPHFLELETYRMRGHFEPDDQAYVDPAELAAWRARDPIELAGQRLVAAGAAGRDELDRMRQRVDAAIEAAVLFANGSAWPDPRELTTEVYA